MCLNYDASGGKCTTGSLPCVIRGFKLAGKIVWYHAENYLFPTRGDPYVYNNVILTPDFIKCATAWVANAAPKPWPNTLKIISVLHYIVQSEFLFIFLHFCNHLGIYVKVRLVKSFVDSAFFNLYKMHYCCYKVGSRWRWTWYLRSSFLMRTNRSLWKSGLCNCKGTNGIKFITHSDEPESVLSGVNKERDIAHLQEGTFAGFTWPIKELDRFAVCGYGQVAHLFAELGIVLGIGWA